MDLNTLYKNILVITPTIAVLVFLTGRLFIRLAGFFQMNDLPRDKRKTDDRRIHEHTLYRSGGFSIGFGLIIGILLLFLLRINLSFNLNYLGVIIGIVIIWVLGIIDDRYELSGKVQLLIQFFACFIISLSGAEILSINRFIPGIIDLTFGHINIFGHQLNILSSMIVTFYLMVVINAINWVDGIGGLSTGMVAIASMAMMVIAIRQGSYEIALLAAILFASNIGYLPRHFPPNTSYPGTAGAYLMGITLGILSILGNTKSVSSILLLILPIIDMIWVIIGRMLKHQTINIFKILNVSDKSHLHHRIMDLGFTQRQTCLIEYAIIASIALVSVLMFGANKVALLIGLSIICIVIFLIIRYRTRNGKN